MSMPLRSHNALRSALTFALMAVAASASAPAAFAQEIASAPAPAPQHVESARFTVVVEGGGPDVILIPGLASPRDVWDSTRAALKAHHTLHIIQIRGFGDDAGVNADGPVLEPFVSDLAQYIEAKIIRAGKPAPAIVGHSLGGLSALTMGIRHPALTGKAIIVDAFPFIGPIFGVSTVDAIRPQAEAMAAAMRAAPVTPETAVDADPGANSQAGFLSKSVAGRTAVAKWTRASDKRVVAQALYDDLVTDVRPELGRIKAPLIVIYAEDSSVMPKGRVDALYAAEYAGAPAVRLVKVDDSRHFIMLDQPEAFNAALSQALEK
jgi:pimeloyl-ACP methyl ester carboxylesterase